MVHSYVSDHRVGCNQKDIVDYGTGQKGYGAYNDWRRWTNEKKFGTKKSKNNAYFNYGNRWDDNVIAYKGFTNEVSLPIWQVCSNLHWLWLSLRSTVYSSEKGKDEWISGYSIKQQQKSKSKIKRAKFRKKFFLLYTPSIKKTTQYLGSREGGLLLWEDLNIRLKSRDARGLVTAGHH